MGEDAQPNKKIDLSFDALLQPFFKNPAPAKKQEEQMSKQEDQLSLNRLLQQLLQNKDSNGVFIGERHDHPSFRQSLTYLMPLLKANGVGTLSLEVGQEMVDSMLKSESFGQWRESADGKKRAAGIPKSYGIEDVYKMIRAADKLGIKVLGHEDLSVTQKYTEERNKYIIKLAMDEQALMHKEIEAEKDPDKKKALIESAPSRYEQRMRDKLTKDETVKAAMAQIAKDFGPESSAGMKKRNDFAAEYIKNNKAPGKVAVWGGAGHTEYASDLLGEKDEGLDKRLDLTAVIINISDARDKVGATKKNTSKGRDTYEVMLPPNLTEFLNARKITSWPPSGGVPTIESPNMANMPPMPKATGNSRSMAPH